MLEIDSINVLNDIHFKKGNSQFYNVDFTDFIIYEVWTTTENQKDKANRIIIFVIILK